MEIINKLVSKITYRRLREIADFDVKSPEIQENTLKSLLLSGKHTAFGKDHFFSDLKHTSLYDDFRQRVPVRTYEQLKPYIDRIIAGEKNVLWNSPIKWFAKSSGTTNAASKFIPISKEALENCHFRGGKDIIALYHNIKPDSKFMLGRGLVIGGSQQINSFEKNSFYGDLSAVIIENLPFWANILKTPNKATALLPEWEEKIEKMAEQTSKVNVTNISGVPSWTLVLLKRILEMTGKHNILDVWPNLELFIHGGVSFSPYRSQYQSIIQSSDMSYMETYNASEGFFGIQNDLSDSAMLLMLDYGVFYEFVPFENIYDEQPQAIPLEDVELGKNYALVITTNGGLWRYMIGDTVKFTDRNPYKFVITGRTKHFINAFGEEVIIENAEKALNFACAETGAVINEYTAAPIYMSDKNTGGHEWVIEFSRQPGDIEMFTRKLDRKLQEVNTDYAAKRHKNLTLRMPVVHLAKQGMFYEWMRQRGKAGGQNKVPRLSNNRDYIDEILKLIK